MMQMANAPANPALMGSSVTNARQITMDILLAKVCTVQSIFMNVRSKYFFVRALALICLPHLYEYVGAFQGLGGVEGVPF